jgi:hypothetical protein
MPTNMTATATRSTVRISRAALMAGTLWIGAAAGQDSAPPPPEARAADAPASRTPDPRAGVVPLDADAPSRNAMARIAGMLPPRTDSPADWQAGIEPLHSCGEPRLLPPCVPPPPCHPGNPPQPFDLIGRPGAPTCGPIYRGPCQPRTGTHDGGPLPRMHRLHDRAFDWFYRTR